MMVWLPSGAWESHLDELVDSLRMKPREILTHLGLNPNTPSGVQHGGTRSEQREKLFRKFIRKSPVGGTEENCSGQESFNPFIWCMYMLHLDDFLHSLDLNYN